MNEKNLKAVGFLALLVSVIVTVIAMLSAAVWNLELGLLAFIIWGISPYICFLAVILLLLRFTSITRISSTFCIVSLLMLALTLFAYVGTLGDKSSTYGLIFVFVPFYLHVGSFFLLGCSLIWGLLSRFFKDKNI